MNLKTDLLFNLIRATARRLLRRTRLVAGCFAMSRKADKPPKEMNLGLPPSVSRMSSRNSIP